MDLKKAGAKTIAAYTIVAVSMIAAIVVMPQGAGQTDIGIWNMLPPVMIFTFIVLTGKVLAGFLWCGFLTTLMYYGAAGSPKGFVDSVFSVVTDWDNWWVIYLFLVGGTLTEIFMKSGAADCMIRWFSSRIGSRRGIMYAMSLLALPFATNDYMTIMLSGGIFTGLLKEKKIPEEMTAYIIRVSATCFSVLLPFGAWSIFFSKQCEKYVELPAGMNGMNWYLAKVLPFLFFPMAALLVCWLVIGGAIRPLGKMKTVYQDMEAGSSAPAGIEELSEEKGASAKTNLSHFIIPVTLVVLFGILFEWEMSYALTWAVLVSFAYFIATGVFSFGDCMDCVVDGFSSMTDMAILMGLALVVIYNLSQMGFVEYLVSLISSDISAALLPAAIFLLFSITELFATFDYTLFMLATPIIVSLASAVGANAGLCLAAMVSASIFGFEFSFSSEGGVLACASCGRIDPYRQTLCQLPFGIISWAISFAAFMLAGFF